MQYLLSYEVAALWNMTNRRITALCRQGRIVGAVKHGKNWMIPADTEMPLDGRTKAYTEQLREAELRHTTVYYTETGAGKNALMRFEELYQRPPDFVEYTPYRICPLGAHTDHNLGKVTGFAIDKGIHMAYGPKMNGVIELASLQFPKRAQWHVAATPTDKQDDWADNLRGATLALNTRYPLRVGLCAIIDGELPIGGFSSSAALILTFLAALSKLNHIALTQEELVDLSLEAENHYVGTASGKLNPFCALYCKKDALLFLDTKVDSYELIPRNPNMLPFSLVLFFSGLEQSLTPSAFNSRVDEARVAAYCMKAFAGIAQCVFSETSLRDVPYEVFVQYACRLPESLRKRAAHWYAENQRVEDGVEAWRQGDLQRFGSLVFESGKSSIELWETGAPELIKLFEILRDTQGVYGARFAGSGFKGCCLGFVNPTLETDVLMEVREKYVEAFPELEGHYSAHICHTADGVIFDTEEK